MKTPLKILIVILTLIIIWFAIRFVFGGPEDDWICVDGQWVKHGSPSAPMPTSGCGSEETGINSFEECAAAGNAVMESWPRQCRDAVGNLFVENIGNELEKLDLIRIDHPRPNQVITSPLTVTGQARGFWFFEGDFPVVLVDWDGKIISQGVAQVQVDPADSGASWMTEDFVPFKAELIFEKPDTQVSHRGSLILQKDNPSGLPENDDALEVPVFFK